MVVGRGGRRVLWGCCCVACCRASKRSGESAPVCERVVSCFLSRPTYTWYMHGMHGVRTVYARCTPGMGMVCAWVGCFSSKPTTIGAREAIAAAISFACMCMCMQCVWHVHVCMRTCHAHAPMSMLHVHVHVHVHSHVHVHVHVHVHSHVHVHVSRPADQRACRSKIVSQ